jgi:hypothetical protein
LARKDGLQRLEDRLQHLGNKRDRKPSERFDQPALGVIRGGGALRLYPLHASEPFEDIAHFLRCGGNLSRRRVTDRGDLQREFQLHVPPSMILVKF